MPDDTGAPSASKAAEDDVVLADGTPIHIRGIRPDDAERLVAFHERLSPESVILRYFGPHPRLSPAEVARLTTVDGVDRFAVVALDGERIVGVARYERAPGTDRAEVAFLVTDEYQGKRLGTMLFGHIAAGARANGIRYLLADTLAENARMLGVFRDSGYRRHYDRFSEVVQVELDMGPQPGAGGDGGGNAVGAGP